MNIVYKNWKVSAVDGWPRDGELCIVMYEIFPGLEDLCIGKYDLKMRAFWCEDNLCQEYLYKNVKRWILPYEYELEDEMVNKNIVEADLCDAYQDVFKYYKLSEEEFEKLWEQDVLEETNLSSSSLVAFMSRNDSDNTKAAMRVADKYVATMRKAGFKRTLNMIKKRYWIHRWQKYYHRNKISKGRNGKLC